MYIYNLYICIYIIIYIYIIISYGVHASRSPPRSLSLWQRKVFHGSAPPSAWLCGWMARRTGKEALGDRVLDRPIGKSHIDFAHICERFCPGWAHPSWRSRSTMAGHMRRRDPVAAGRQLASQGCRWLVQLRGGVHRPIQKRSRAGLGAAWHIWKIHGLGWAPPSSRSRKWPAVRQVQFRESALGANWSCASKGPGGCWLKAGTWP